MDDDDDSILPFGQRQPRAQPAHFAAVVADRGRGRYQAPDSGIIWMWHRPDTGGNLYSKLSVRDSAANTDLCVLEFNPIKGADKTTRGRRTNTVIPMEDRDILKGELTSDAVRLNVTSGSLLDTHCIPSSCSLRDLEFAIGIVTPWDSENKHRLEIPNAQAKRTGETMVGPASKTARKQSFESATAVVDPCVSTGTLPEEQRLSSVSHALQSISAALGPLGSPLLVEHLKNLTEWLTVS